MNDHKDIEVLFPDGAREEGTLVISRNEPWKVRIEQPRLGKLQFGGDTLYGALTALRRELESQNCYLLCNGARRNIIVSGMSRQMSGGRKGYLVSLGKPASRNDIVDIFDYAEPSTICSVSDQGNFYKQWVKSLADD